MRKQSPGHYVPGTDHPKISIEFRVGSDYSEESGWMEEDADVFFGDVKKTLPISVERIE